jgi:long-subunit fatty acid transport protein
MGVINYRPLEKLNLTLSGSYTVSDGGMDALSDYSALCNQLADMVSYSYDLHTVHTYSDLDITQKEVSVQAAYRLDDNFTLGAGISYMRYDDAEPYLYDGSGDAYFVSIGMSYTP